MGGPVSYVQAGGRKRGPREAFPEVELSETTRAVIRGYLVDCERRGPAIGQRDPVRHHLLNFARFVHPIEVLDADRQHVLDMLDSRRMVPRTAYGGSTLHNFFEWAVLEGLGDHDPTLRIRRPRSPRVVARPIADKDLADALKAADARWLPC